MAETTTLPTQNIVKKVFCNHCHGRTNHVLKAEHANYVEDDGQADEFVYRFWACAGCGHATMEMRFLDCVPADPAEREEIDPDEIDPEVYTYSYYPERKIGHLSPKTFSKLNSKLNTIYRESILSFNAGCLILCSAGLRSLLEGVCHDKKVKGRTLEERIENLQFLLPNKNIIRHLHHFRFTGNKAMHELEAPCTRDVELAIEVIQDLLNYIYELDYKASKLKVSRRRKQPIHKHQKSTIVLGHSEPDISKVN